MVDRRSWLRLPVAGPTQGFTGPAPAPPTPGGAGGSVTSVALALPSDVFAIDGSPVQSVGTLRGAFVDQPASWALLGPAAGQPDGTPHFRAISTSDIAGTLLGDVTGSLLDNRVEKIWNRPVDSSAPVIDDVLRWDGTQWQVFPGLFGTGSANRVTYWTDVNRVSSTPAFQFDGSSIMNVTTNFLNGPVRIEAQNTVGTGIGTAEVRALNNSANGIALRVSGSTTSTSRFGQSMANWGRLEGDGSVAGLMIGTAGLNVPVAIGVNSVEVARFAGNGSSLIGVYLQLNATASASSTTTGALRVAGGVGVVENLFVGGTGSFAGRLTTAASGGLRILPGTTPSSMVDGLVWIDGSAMYARVSGVTYQLTSGSISGSGTANQLTYWSGPTTISSNSRFSLTPTTGAQKWITSGFDWATIQNDSTTIKTRLRYDDRAFEILGNMAPSSGGTNSTSDTWGVGWTHANWTGAGPGFTPAFRYSMNYFSGRQEFEVGDATSSSVPTMYQTFSIGKDYVRVHAGTAAAATSTTTGALRVSGGLGVTGDSYFGGRMQLLASTSSTAALRIPHGSDPLSANLVDGDIWTTSLGVYARVAGSTISLGGGAGSLVGSGAINQVTFWSGATSLTGDANFLYVGGLLTLTASANSFKGIIAETSATGTDASMGLQARNTTSTVVAHAGVWTGTSSAQLLANSARFTGEGTSLTRVLYGGTSTAAAFTVPVATVIGTSVVYEATGRGTTVSTALSDTSHGFRIYYTADSSGSTTGALTVAGGAYIAKTARVAGDVVLTGTLRYSASTASTAKFNMPHGTAPTSPADGDMWSTSTGFYVRVNGNTLLISPSGVLVGTGTAGQVTFWDGSSLLAGNASFLYDNVNGIVNVAHTTASTSATTGAFKVAGGVGIAGNTNIQQYLGVGLAAGSYSGALAVQISGTRVATFVGATTSAEIDIRQGSGNGENVKYGISSAVAYFGTFSGVFTAGNGAAMPLDIYSNGIRRTRLTATHGSFQFGHTTAEVGFRVNLWHANDNGIIWAIQKDAQTSGTYNALGRWRQELSADRLQTTLPDSTLGDRYYTIESRTVSGTVKLLTAVHNDGRIGVARIPTAYRLEAEDGQPVAWFHNTLNGDDKVSVILSGTTVTNRKFTGLRFSHDQYTTGWGADIMARDEGTFGTSLLFFTNPGTTASSTPVLRMTLGSNGVVTLTGRLVTAAPTSSAAGVFLTPGVAPVSPVDGDFWLTGTGVYARVAGATINLTGGGGGGGGSGAAGQVTVWSTSTITSGSNALTFSSGVLSISDATAAGVRWTNTTATGATATIGVDAVNVGSAVNWVLRSYNGSGTAVSDLIRVTHAGVVTIGGATTINGAVTLGSTLSGTDISSSTFVQAPLFKATPGTGPGTPANGDLWATSSDLFIRLGGTTRQLTGGVTGTGTANTLTYFPTTSSVASVAISNYDSTNGQLTFTGGSTPEILKFVSSGAGTPGGVEFQVGGGGRRWVVGVDSGTTGWNASSTSGYLTVRDRTTATNRLTISPTDGAFAVLADSAAVSTVSGTFSTLGVHLFATSSAARPSARFTTGGVDPTTPLDGDMWLTATGLFFRFSGVSINLLAASGGAITDSAFTMPTSRLLGRSSVGTGAIETIQIGSGLTLAGGILTASGGGGGSGSSGSANIWTALNTFTGGVVISGSPYLQLEDILSATNPVVAKGTLFVNTGLSGGVVTGLWYSSGSLNYQIPGMNAANNWTGTNTFTAASTFNALSTFSAGVRITGSTYLRIDSVGTTSNPSVTAGTLFVNFGASGARSGLFFATNTGTVQLGALETDNVWTGSNTFAGAMTPQGSLSLGNAFAPNTVYWDAGAGAYTIPNSVHVLINSASTTTAAATVTFPSSPLGKAEIVICAGAGAITALTLAAPGEYTIAGSTTTLPAFSSVQYHLVGTVWTRVR